MTDQPSQQPPDETRDDVPGSPSPDAPAGGAPTGEAAPAEPAAKPSAPAPEAWAPTAEPAFGTTEPGPTPYESGAGVASRLASVFPADHPERAVGAAFAGGLVMALILKRLAH